MINLATVRTFHGSGMWILKNLKNSGKHIGVLCLGNRGEDMAVRLKYAGIYGDKITLIKDYEELLNKALEDAQEEKSYTYYPHTQQCWT